LGWEISRAGFREPERAEPLEVQDWKVKTDDVRADTDSAQKIMDFVERHGVLSIIMTDGILGCPHQQGIDYEGEWCLVCEFWHGRDRFTGQRIH
jgi:hypothetical protein